MSNNLKTARRLAAFNVQTAKAELVQALKERKALVPVLHKMMCSPRGCECGCWVRECVQVRLTPEQYAAHRKVTYARKVYNRALREHQHCSGHLV